MILRVNNGRYSLHGSYGNGLGGTENKRGCGKEWGSDDFLGILEFAGDVGVKDRVFVSVNGWSVLVLLPHSSMKMPSCRHVAFEKSNR